MICFNKIKNSNQFGKILSVHCREKDRNAKVIIEMNGPQTSIINPETSEYQDLTSIRGLLETRNTQSKIDKGRSLTQSLPTPPLIISTPKPTAKPHSSADSKAHPQPIPSPIAHPTASLPLSHAWVYMVGLLVERERERRKGRGGREGGREID